MKLAIADPPYLGRARRWYGEGRGHAAGRGRADQHPDAGTWDSPEAHQRLVAGLEEEFDGWAIAMSPDSLGLYLDAAPSSARVACWTRGNAIPSGSRVRSLWEPVLVRVPEARRAHGTGAIVDDVLTAGITPGGFPGRKPDAWTHWVLTMLGYDPAEDELADVFPGSGAVTAAAATYAPPTPTGRRRTAPPAQAQQVRRTARASTSRKAAVLAALRAGGSVRAVAADARLSTNTVQRWKREAGISSRTTDQRGAPMVLCEQCDGATYLEDAPAEGWTTTGPLDLCPACTAREATESDRSVADAPASPRAASPRCAIDERASA